MQEHVGIRHIRHCHSIIEHLGRLPRLTFCVEGNISAGKSTFLDIVRNFDRNMQRKLQVCPEMPEAARPLSPCMFCKCQGLWL